MLHPLGNNQNAVTGKDGLEVFFSYRTPVAVFIPGQGVLKTKKKWSVTTSTHINNWLKRYSPNVTVELVDQEVLDKYRVVLEVN